MPADSQIGVILYTLRDYLKTPKDIAKTLKRVAKIGYKNIQVSGIGEINPLDLRKIADDNGLKIIGAHISMEQFRNEFDNVIDKLHAWGAKYAAMPYPAGWDKMKLPQWKKYAKELQKIGKAMHTEELILQYHNHDMEFMRFGGKTVLDIIYSTCDHKYMQAEIDTHWVARGGCDPVSWCMRMKGRMDQVHFKDLAIVEGKPVTAEVGAGNLNWPAIIKACAVAGVKHYIVEQDNCPVTKNPFKSIEISLKNLRKLGLK